MNQQPVHQPAAAKQVGVIGPGNHPVPLSLRARLKHRLLAADSVQELMRSFFNTVREAVPLDGMRYEHEERDLRWSTGVPGTHRARYQLNSASGDHGSLVFSRRRGRFDEAELEQLEVLMGSLIYPLKIVTLLQRSGAGLASGLRGGEGGERLHKQLTKRCAQGRETGEDALLLLEIDGFDFLQGKLPAHEMKLLTQYVQERVQGCLQLQDQLFTLGSRQLGVLLGNAQRQRAMLTAELIQLRLDADPVCLPSSEVRISASIGLAMLETEDTPHKWLDRAEIGLMMARHNGGAQTRCVDNGMIQPDTLPSIQQRSALSASR